MAKLSQQVFSVFLIVLIVQLA